MITPKQDFIKKVLEITCRHCSRRMRIENRLTNEICEQEFDFERHNKVDRIINEEA
jgi:hypothetical protein